MEKKPAFTTSPSTPLTKQNLKIRIVSNSDKENISNEVFLSPPDHSPFTSSNSQKISFFIEVPPIPQEILNPFLVEFKKASQLSEFAFSDSYLGDSRSNLKKTDSLQTTDSLGSELSLLSLNNKNKGYQIPKNQEERVFADLTAEYVPQRKMSDLGPNGVQEIRRDSNLNMQIEEPPFQRRKTFPVRNLNGNKENKSKNLIQPLLKYKNKRKKRTRFGIRKANSRKSMRI